MMASKLLIFWWITLIGVMIAGATLTKETHLPNDCGLRTQKSDSPWTVMIYRNANLLYWYQEDQGTIISKRYVMTTRPYKWLDRNHKKPRRVVLELSSYPRFIKDFENYPHVNVIRNESLVQSNDTGTFIAFLRLDSDIAFNDLVQPICLPITEELRAAQPGQFTLHGFMHKCQYYDQLSLSSSEVDASKCVETFNRTESDHAVCAELPDCIGYPSTASFQYDSKQVLLGYEIVRNCWLGLTMIAKIEYNIDWILENIKP